MRCSTRCSPLKIWFGTRMANSWRERVRCSEGWRSNWTCASSWRHDDAASDFQDGPIKYSRIRE